MKVSPTSHLLAAVLVAWLSQASFPRTAGATYSVPPGDESIVLLEPNYPLLVNTVINPDTGAITNG